MELFVDNGIDLNHAETMTPEPSQNWLAMEPALRQKTCQELLNANNRDMDVITANVRGEVIVQLRKPLGPAERGTVLLDTENILKKHEPALTIYLQAAGDRNALRKLRGVVIHDDRD